MTSKVHSLEKVKSIANGSHAKTIRHISSIREAVESSSVDKAKEKLLQLPKDSLARGVDSYVSAFRGRFSESDAQGLVYFLDQHYDKGLGEYVTIQALEDRDPDLAFMLCLKSLNGRDNSEYTGLISKSMLNCAERNKYALDITSCSVLPIKTVPFFVNMLVSEKNLGYEEASSIADSLNQRFGHGYGECVVFDALDSTNPRLAEDIALKGLRNNVSGGYREGLCNRLSR